MEFNNITFSNLTILPPPPIYTFDTIPSSIDEGSSGTFNVITYNEVPNGTTLYWTINNSTTASADFLASSGSFTVNNRIGSFTVRALSDSLTEGNESFAVQIRTVSTSGNIVATSSTVTINDTSTTPLGGFGSYVIVAGGGAGGGTHNSGGGGAGGVVKGTNIAIAPGKSYTISVGAGGAGDSTNARQGDAGGSSGILGAGFTAATAIGGGGGGSADAQRYGGNGGSGGGSSAYGRTDAYKGLGTAGQGNNGGRGAKAGASEGGGYGGAGGGGYGGGGADGRANKGGDGGSGIQWIDGNYYAGGGGGAVYVTGVNNTKVRGYGGIGGGGQGEQWTTGHPIENKATSGETNTGGGGGGVSGYFASYSQPGSGGSGVVIIRYADSIAAATSTTGSPIYTVSGGYRTYKFTASGSITF
jgi:hypothetical protein